MGTGIGLRSTLKTLKRFGTPPKWLCEKNTECGSLLNRPELFCYTENFAHLQYVRLDSPWQTSRYYIDAMKFWLSHGNPFLLGFAVPHNISIDTTLIPLDVRRGGTIGGTSCVVMGYDDELRISDHVPVYHERIENSHSGAFLIQTNWGHGGQNYGVSNREEWGFAWLPYAYIETRFACDAWAIKPQAS